MADKKTLSEQVIRDRYVTPAIAAAGWDVGAQVREEHTFADGRAFGIMASTEGSP